MSCQLTFPPASPNSSSLKPIHISTKICPLSFYCIPPSQSFSSFSLNKKKKKNTNCPFLILATVNNCVLNAPAAIKCFSQIFACFSFHYYYHVRNSNNAAHSHSRTTRNPCHSVECGRTELYKNIRKRVATFYKIL